MKSGYCVNIGNGISLKEIIVICLLAILRAWCHNSSPDFIAYNIHWIGGGARIGYDVCRGLSGAK
eukprot:scaffold108757_cov60-Cyclotella_meneghiniana.AAC.2